MHNQIKFPLEQVEKNERKKKCKEKPTVPALKTFGRNPIKALTSLHSYLA